MLRLAGIEPEASIRTFEYELPKSMAPGSKKCFVRIHAKPMSPFDETGRQRIENFSIALKVKRYEREEAFKATKDAEAYHRAEVELTKWVEEKAAAILYDNAVDSWETNLGLAGGGTLEPTRENFISLFSTMTFHLPIYKMVEKVREDVAKMNSFALDAEKETNEELVKN